MKLNISGNAILSGFLLLILFGTVTSVGGTLQSSNSIWSIGSINYWPRVDVTINIDKVIGANNLSLGFQLEWDFKGWYDSPIRTNLARNANFKLVRLFSCRIEPCTYWNESTKTGTFNWANVDAYVKKIFEIGAEPLVTLGFARSSSLIKPSGMATNPTTGLPYPSSYAAYATEWVTHFKALNLPVRYYEIVNEPAAYFGYSPPNLTKLGYYVELWNAAARAMRAINPKLSLSQDCITLKGVLEYWIQHGDDVDSLNFHKYDAYATPGYDDATMLARAETRFFETSGSYWGFEDARRMWFDARGKLLPLINSESNLNSAWESGTDPRIQQMVGATWLALVLRMGVLKGLSYNVYYALLSGASGGKNTQTGGAGFGMVNSDDDKPWYPYYVNFMLGNNLNAGDALVNSTSSSSEIRVVAWTHNRTVNIFVISKVDQVQAIYLFGLKGTFNATKIDKTIPWQNAALQTSTFNITKPFITNGYTVALLQTTLNS